MSDVLRRIAPVTILSVYVFSWLLSASLQHRTGTLRADLEETVVLGLSLLGFAVLAAMLVRRHPTNPMGWLFAAIAIVASTFSLGAYGEYAVTHGQHDALAVLGFWLNAWLWIPLLSLLFVFTPLLFPTGRLLSRRWRWLVWIVTVDLAIISIDGMLAAKLVGQENPDLVIDNPIGVEGFPHFQDVSTAGALFVVFLASVVAAFLSLVIRYRRSRGEERLQLKWFVFAVALIPLSMPFETVPIVSPVMFSLIFLSLPVAIGVAIFKYRLYDIDVVISRTLIFAGLAAFITGIYVAIVVGVGTLIGAGDDPNLALSIVATALVAVAFQPVRERLTKVANRLVYGKRATPYEVLSRFSSHLGETVATEQTLEQMARLLAEGTGAARAQVWLKAGGQMRTAASWPSDAAPDLAPVVADDGSLPEFAQVDLAVPIGHQDQLLGALTLTKKRGESINPTEHKLVEQLAAQAGLVLKNVQLTADLLARLEELRESRRRLVAAQDDERRRLERDLHDGAQQQLVALKIKLGIAKTLAEREQAPRTAALVGQVAGDADDAVATLRELAHGIYPPLLAAEGLAVALQGQARKAAIRVTVTADGIGRYPQEVEAAVYFCVLEALNNTAKYANATHATVTLTDTDGDLTFAVTDDGTGFRAATTPYGQGITNITDRLHALGGEAEIRSAPGEGTTIGGRVLTDRKVAP
ncbi:MAG: hypothetical protein KY462_15655 [Actinobacteria bacterium]|nr:hypothetical protein [Actinomycetota bacterium]